MSAFDGLLHQLRVWVRGAEYERQIHEEVRFHIELDAEQQRGRFAADAPNVARRRFGNATAVIEETRGVAGLALGDDIAHDARHLTRSLRRSPGFALIAIGTLALGIGATTAILSVVDHVLVHSLPYRDDTRLMSVYERDASGNVRTPSAPTVRDWQADSATRGAFDGVSFVRGDNVVLDGADGAERVTAGFVDREFFPVLGVRPRLGRTLVEDDQRPSAAPVVVLSYGLWHRRFGGDPSIIGRAVTIDSMPTTIVGVLDVGAQYPAFAQLWQPLGTYRNPAVLERRGLHADSRTIGRLRTDVDSTRASDVMRVVGARLAAAYPAEQKGWSMSPVPVRDEVVGDVRPMLLALAAASGVILLLACANVANLLLARMSTRGRELAVRSAIGASRGRLVRQLATEMVLLAAAGGVLGAALAAFAVGLARKLPPTRLPRADELSIDGRVIAIAVAASLLTAIVCGLWPALRATRPMSGEGLRTGSHGSGTARSESRLRRGLVTVQFSLALMLLVGAGLLLQSFRRAAGVSVGFDPHGLVTITVSPNQKTYGTPDAAAALYARLMTTLRAVPGVSDVGLINHFPFGSAAMPSPIEVEGAVTDTSTNQAFYRTVSDTYLPTMKMSLLAGRWFSADDMRSPAGVFVINATMARRLWPGVSAIGKRVTTHRASQARADFGQPISGTVIGVVNDVTQFQQDVAPEPEIYVPFTLEVWPWATLVVRTRNGAQTIPALRRALADAEPSLLLATAQPGRGFAVVENSIASSLEQRRFTLTLIGVFAGCALVLAGIGMYGVVAYGVTQRTREMGVRKALGATERMIVSLVMRESLVVAVAGVALGCAGAWAGARLINGLLFDTGPADPAAYIVTIFVLTGAALVATYFPARRAARMDPTIAMRDS